MYNAVIFDLFGTLTGNLTSADYDNSLSAMAGALTVDPSGFRQAWWSSIADRMVGRFGDMTGNVRAVCGLLGAEPSDAQVTTAVGIRLDLTRRILANPRVDAAATLAALRAAGLKTALISGCTAEVPALWRETVFADLFDATVFSCVEGLRKPDPRIYRLACSRIGMTPQECVCVGDGSDCELAGARDVGMRAVLIASPHVDLAGVDRTDAHGWMGDAVSELSEVIALVG